MAKSCIVCKVKGIAHNSRTFHRFPINDITKKAWMKAIGVSSISKNAMICSDHFDERSYHQTDGYTYLRRLLKNAVPSVNLYTNKNVSMDTDLQDHIKKEKIDDLEQHSTSSMPPKVLGIIRNSREIGLQKTTGIETMILPMQPKAINNITNSNQLKNAVPSVNLYTNKNVSMNTDLQDHIKKEKIDDLEQHATSLMPPKVLGIIINSRETGLQKTSGIETMILPMQPRAINNITNSNQLKNEGPSVNLYTNKNVSLDTDLQDHIKKEKIDDLEQHATSSMQPKILGIITNSREIGPQTTSSIETMILPMQPIAINNITNSNQFKNVCDELLIPIDACSSSNLSRKRKQSSTTKESEVPKKKIRFRDNFQTYTITRDFFVSDDKWNIFLKYCAVKNRQRNTQERRNNRQKTKIRKLKELVTN